MVFNKLLIIYLICLCYGVAFSQNQSIEDQLDDLFSKEFNENKPGGTVLIQKGDEIVFSGAYGLADVNSKELITENTVFNTGSISKTFVANAILILQDRGLLSIEDTLDKYFDDFENKDISSKVKIEHLLSHTSGLPDIRRVSKNRTFFLTAKDKGNFDPIKKADDLNFESGESFEYSNPAYNGLALIVEKVSGQMWQQFIIDNIFKPCSMPLSKITDGPHPSEGVAHGYVNSGGRYEEADYGEIPTFAASGNGGVWSTILELTNYEKCIQNATFLDAETVEKSRTIYHPENWNSSKDPFIGHGWFLGENSLIGEGSDLNVEVIYHTGSQGGFRAFFISIPEKNIVSIGLFNTPMSSYRRFILEPLLLLSKHNWLD